MLKRNFRKSLSIIVISIYTGFLHYSIHYVLHKIFRILTYLCRKYMILSDTVESNSAQEK